MKWFISLLAPLVIVGQASWSLAQPIAREALEVRFDCAVCCESETANCGTVRTVCERACSAAILPAPAFAARPPSRLVHLPQLAGRLASRTTRPALPPPRGGAVTN